MKHAEITIENRIFNAFQNISGHLQLDAENRISEHLATDLEEASYLLELTPDGHVFSDPDDPARIDFLIEPAQTDGTPVTLHFPAGIQLPLLGGYATERAERIAKYYTAVANGTTIENVTSSRAGYHYTVSA